MIRSWISSLRLATIKSTRLKAFKTARSMPGSKQDSYQGSTIWFCGKATLRKRISGSLHWQSSTFEGLSPLTTKTTQKSRQRDSSPLIQPYRWLDPSLHKWRGLRWLQQRNVVNLLRPPPPSEQKNLKPLICLILSGFPPPFPVWVGRFFIELIVWFSSPTSHLGWKVFYWTS